MTASPTVRTATAIADPDQPTHVLRPHADGTMPVSANLTLDPTNLNLEATQLLIKTAVQSLATAIAASSYETVAASQTGQVLGGSGAIGDYLARIIITPALAACGVVTVLDNATPIISFAGGATTALTDLLPKTIEIGAKSASGAWKITTGASVAVVGIGNFT